MKRLKDFLYPVVVLFAVLVLATVIQYGGWLKTSPVYAGTGQSLSGFAWSDNIGWISFNCTNPGGSCAPDYGVNIDPSTGNFSGYAWSENIGWISFNPSDVTGCPSAPCSPTINITTGAVTGWAKALSAAGNGWDGWIKLADTTAPAYGPILSGTAFSGYSWGSDVVGWISWSAVTSTPLISATLLVDSVPVSPGPGGASVTTIDNGKSATLTWSSKNTTSCTAQNGFNVSYNGTATASSTGVSTGPLTSNQSYVMNCLGPNSSSVNSNYAIVNVNQPDIRISASPARVSAGGTSSITWSASQVSSCTIVGDGIPLTNARTDGLPTTQVVSVIAQQTYTITCNTGFGTTIPKSAIVNIGSTTIKEF